MVKQLPWLAFSPKHVYCQAPTHQNTHVNQEDTQPDQKKKKVEECVGGAGSDTNIKSDEHEQITAGNKGQQGNSDFKFTTGITQLKMPGHTGFLTFASVPPGLARNKISCVAWHSPNKVKKSYMLFLLYPTPIPLELENSQVSQVQSGTDWTRY